MGSELLERAALNDDGARFENTGVSVEERDDVEKRPVAREAGQVHVDLVAEYISLARLMHFALMSVPMTDLARSAITVVVVPHSHPSSSTSSDASIHSSIDSRYSWTPRVPTNFVMSLWEPSLVMIDPPAHA